MYLTDEQVKQFRRLLETFFVLPYSTDLDGKDVETLLRIVKNVQGHISKRKELFDIVDGEVGYSVKTLSKSLTAKRVDLQEQRFCDVEEIRRMVAGGIGSEIEQGRIVLSYMKNRIQEQMSIRNIKTAKSLILLKNWNKNRTKFIFQYWEEDFLEYIDRLLEKNKKGEIEWVQQKAGLHGRDRMRQDDKNSNIRLIRMHYKHNQIFTDHDILSNVVKIEFEVQPLSWEDLIELLDKEGKRYISEKQLMYKNLPLFQEGADH